MVPTAKSISVAVALRACEAVCRLVRDDGFSGATAKDSNFVMCRRPAPEDVEKHRSFFRNLIASGYSAERPACLCRVFVPNNLTFVFSQFAPCWP